MVKKIYITDSEKDELLNLSRRIKLARKRRMMTQEDVAKKSEISLNAYKKIEKGHDGASLSVLIKVLQTFGYKDKILELFPEEEENKNNKLANF